MTRREDNTKPVVSVILCTYNRAHLVRQATESVAAQTFKDWELIIIDDGSKDETATLLLPLVLRDPRIVFVRRENRGLAQSRNEGITLAQGEYITFLDSDDAYSPNHLAVRVALMRKNPSIDFTYGGLKCVGPREKQYVPDADNPGKKIHLSKCLAAGTLFAKATVLKRSGGFPGKEFAEDYRFISTLLTKHTALKTNRKTYLYNCLPEDRMCEIYAREGEEGLLKFRGKL